MKRTLVISYWVLSILLVAVILTSLGYRFMEAVFISTVFLPGALAAKYFFPKVDFRNRRTGVKDTVFIVLGILVAEVFLFLMTHFYILRYRENVADWMGLPEILTNPIFIALILTALAAGSYFFERWLDRLRPTAPAPITFTSDRKPVTLPLGEILYVESNDATTTVPHFLRIHRSYLVNKEAITQVDGDLLYINDIELPISRKYKDAVVNEIPGRGRE